MAANQKQFEAAPEIPDVAGPAAFSEPVPAPNFGGATQVPPTPTFEDPVPAFEEPKPAAPSFDEPTPVQPVPSFEEPKPATPSFEPAPFPETPAYTSPAAAAPSTGVNYEETYNDLKIKFDRCNAELEKVTNENIDLRIKIDDIREILNED